MMSTIMPVSELSDNPGRILKLCHSQDEPVFLTKDGYGDTVVMSFDQYELLKSQAQASLEKTEINHAQVFSEPDVSVKNSTSAASVQNLDGIKKLPLEDVIDVLKNELKKEQLADDSKRKRFP